MSETNTSDNFTVFLAIFRLFLITLTRKWPRKSTKKTCRIKLPTRHDLLPERNARGDRPSAPSTREIVNRQIKETHTNQHVGSELKIERKRTCFLYDSYENRTRDSRGVETPVQRCVAGGRLREVSDARGFWILERRRKPTAACRFPDRVFIASKLNGCRWLNHRDGSRDFAAACTQAVEECCPTSGAEVRRRRRRAERDGERAAGPNENRPTAIGNERRNNRPIYIIYGLPDLSGISKRFLSNTPRDFRYSSSH